MKDEKLVTGGSGFFVNEEGFLATAWHVIEPSLEDDTIGIFVNFQKRLYSPKIIAFEKEKDLAVLKIEAGMRVPCVGFRETTSVKPNESLMFIGIPPSWETYADGTYLTMKDRMISRNHKAIIVENPAEMLDHPDTNPFLQDTLLKNIFCDPVIARLLSDPAARRHLPYPKETVDLLTFFLANRESRLFFSDPDTMTKAGCSGGAAFDEEGNLAGMLQEILAVFWPNPKSRYINPNKPPEDNKLFPLLGKMICAGQNADHIKLFLERNGISY